MSHVAVVEGGGVPSTEVPYETMNVGDEEQRKTDSKCRRCFRFWCCSDRCFISGLLSTIAAYGTFCVTIGFLGDDAWKVAAAVFVIVFAASNYFLRPDRVRRG